MQLVNGVTEATVMDYLTMGDYTLALTSALILQEPTLGKRVLRSTPPSAIALATSAVPTSAFPSFVHWVANEVSSSQFVEHSLLWAHAIVTESNEPLVGHARSPAVLSSLKLLHRALNSHRMLYTLFNENHYTVQYLTDSLPL